MAKRLGVLAGWQRLQGDMQADDIRAAYDCPAAGGRLAKVKPVRAVHGRLIDRMTGSTVKKTPRAGPRRNPIAWRRQWLLTGLRGGRRCLTG